LAMLENKTDLTLRVLSNVNYLVRFASIILSGLTIHLFFSGL
jgi:hypothetical protein